MVSSRVVLPAPLAPISATLRSSPHPEADLIQQDPTISQAKTHRPTGVRVDGPYIRFGSTGDTARCATIAVQPLPESKPAPWWSSFQGSGAGGGYPVGRCALMCTGCAVGDGGDQTRARAVVRNIDPTQDSLW